MDGRSLYIAEWSGVLLRGVEIQGQHVTVTVEFSPITIIVSNAVADSDVGIQHGIHIAVATSFLHLRAEGFPVACIVDD